MKKSGIFLALFVGLMLPLAGQNAKFQEAMGKTLAQFADCKSVQDFNQLSNKFKVIANAEPGEWLPLYYRAHCQIIMSFMEQGDAALKDAYLDVAEDAVDQMIELVPEESEVFALQAFMYTARLVVNPMVRGREYSMRSNSAANKALGFNADNPRAKYVLLSNEMGQARFFGGDLSQYCDRGREIKAGWENYTVQSEIHPRWGKDQMANLLASCPNKGVTLTVDLPKLRSNEGAIFITLMDENENMISSKKGAINEKKATITFDGLEPGYYAVQYFHDENGNAELDFGAFGKPKEGYGNSNDARGFMSAPKFKDTIFELKADMTISLKTAY